MNANIWRTRNDVKLKVASTPNYFRAGATMLILRPRKIHNCGVIDWKIVRRELVVARIKAGLEESDLAAAIGIDVSTVYRIEKTNSAKNNPSIDIIASWSEACGMRLSEFLAIVQNETENVRKGDASEIIPAAVLNSSERPRIAQTTPSTTQESQAQHVPSSAVEHGQIDTVSRLLHNLHTAIAAMADATSELRTAAAIYRSIVAKPVVDAGRQAPSARAQSAGHSKGNRKNR